MNTSTHPPSARGFASFPAALKGAFPTGKKPSSRAAVILLSWANDDDMGFGVLGEGGACGYQTEHYQVPASIRDVRRAVNKRINKFIGDWDGHGYLLIYVYSGHAISMGTVILQ